VGIILGGILKKWTEKEVEQEKVENEYGSLHAGISQRVAVPIAASYGHLQQVVAQGQVVDWTISQ